MAGSTRDIEQIETELLELKAERRAYARSVNGWLREDLLDLVDRRVAEASASVDALLGQLDPAAGVPSLENVGRQGLLDLAALHAFGTDTALHERMRAAIRELPEEMFACTRAEANQRLGDFDARIARLEQERRDLEKLAALAEVEAQFA